MELISLILRLESIPLQVSVRWKAALLERIHSLLEDSHTSVRRVVCALRIVIPSDITFGSVRMLYALLLEACTHMPFLHHSVLRLRKDRVYVESWEDFPREWTTIWGDALVSRAFVWPKALSSVEEGPLDESLIFHPPWHQAETFSLPTTANCIHSIAFGGSFDGLHAGHKIVLDALMDVAMMSASSKEVLIGISDDEVVIRKPGGAIAQAFDVRVSILRRAVECMMNCRGYALVPEEQRSSDSQMIQKVKDRYKTAVDEFSLVASPADASLPTKCIFACTNLDARGIGVAGDTENLDALLLTTETIRGGDLVNSYRGSLGLAPLLTIVCPLVVNFHGDKTSKLSSRDERGILVEWLTSHARHQCLQKLWSQWKVTAKNERLFLRYYFLPLCAAGLNEPDWDKASLADDLPTFLQHLMPCTQDSKRPCMVVRRLAESMVGHREEWHTATGTITTTNRQLSSTAGS